MKKSILYFALALPLFLSSCYHDWSDCSEPLGPEEVFVIQSRDIEGLIVNCNVDVHVYHSRNPRVEVIAAANIADRLDVIFHGGDVTIDHNGCIQNRHIRVEVYTPGLLFTRVDGSGDIVFYDYNDVDRSHIEIDGSGDIYYMGDSREISCLIDGSGDIELLGTVRNLEIDISGSGDVEAFEMQADHVYIEVDGSGDSEVWAERTLTVDVDGSGDVYFIGYPDLRIRDHGSGDVIDAN